MEKFTSKEKIEKNFGIMVKMGESLVDTARRVSYPASFLPALFAYEIAHGAEIPEHATLQEGIHILREASVLEIMETGAAYIEVNENHYWISNEGEEPGKAEDHSSLEHEEREMFIEKFKELDAIEGDNVSIKFIHNHPYNNENGRLDEYGYTLINDDVIHYSMPPSGAGLLGVQDTGSFRMDAIASGVAKIEAELNITVDAENYVVDPIGIWHTEAIWHDEDVRTDRFEEIYNLYTEYMNGNVDIENRLFTLGRELIDNLEAAKRTWFTLSQTLPGEELIQHEAYNNLVAAYRDLGINVTYKPFETDE